MHHLRARQVFCVATSQVILTGDDYVRLVEEEKVIYIIILVSGVCTSNGHKRTSSRPPCKCDGGYVYVGGSGHVAMAIVRALPPAHRLNVRRHLLDHSFHLRTGGARAVVQAPESLAIFHTHSRGKVSDAFLADVFITGMLKGARCCFSCLWRVSKGSARPSRP